MKICYITDLLSPYRIEWMNLISKEFEVYAYYFEENEKTREEKWLSSVKNEFKKFRLKSRRILGIKFYNGIYRILKRNEYDIYIIDGYSSLVKIRAILRLAKDRKNVFVNIDGIDIWKKENIISRLKYILKIRVYRSGAKFLCGSQIACNRIIELGAKKENVFKHPFTTIYQSDIIEFEDKIRLQDEYKEKINAKDKKVVIAVGRFIPLKRYEDLIKSWVVKKRDCVLYLIGSGALKETYEKLISDLSIKNIIILDHMDKDALNQYYIAADLFVHTSSTEAWGLVFNEAMAKGCPVISTNHCVGGVELVENGKNGYIVGVGDVKQLHDCIINILLNSDLKTEMIKNSIDKIKSYTYENMAKTHICIFRNSVDNNHN